MSGSNIGVLDPAAIANAAQLIATAAGVATTTLAAGLVHLWLMRKDQPQPLHFPNPPSNRKKAEPQRRNAA